MLEAAAGLWHTGWGAGWIPHRLIFPEVADGFLPCRQAQPCRKWVRTVLLDHLSVSPSWDESVSRQSDVEDLLCARHFVGYWGHKAVGFTNKLGCNLIHVVPHLGSRGAWLWGWVTPGERQELGLFFFFFNLIATLFIYLFIYLFLAVLGLRFVRGLSLVAASGGHSSSWCGSLSLTRPLPLRGTGSRRACSVVVAHGPSCSAACGIFPDQGSNPCPLH